MEQNILEEIRTAVDDENVDVSSEGFFCGLCQKSYTHIQNLSRHQRSVHNVEREPHGSLRCPQENCEYMCNWMDTLRHHLRNSHGIRVEEIQLTFPSMSEFTKWKEVEERSTNSKFIASSAVKKLHNGSRKTYLNCHRSGDYRPRGVGKRKMKAQGSCKMNRCCPASMTVEEQPTEVVVQYYKTHCGHGNSSEDVTHLRLTESERALIAGKLAQGITFESLLEDLRNQSRFRLLTRQDLRNIQSSFKEPRVPDANSEPDTWESWVQKSYSLGDNCPILYCKDRGVVGEDGLAEEDFLLVVCNPIQREVLTRFGGSVVCIDVMDAGSSADFILMTVVVVDDYGEPCPAAFCLSNRVDADTYLCFFKALHDRVGKVTPVVFVSDNVPAVDSAWSQVMGEYERRYFCPWWTEQAFCKTVLTNISPDKKMKRVTAHRWLQDLLDEMDMEKFHHQLNAFLEEMQKARDTKNFASHFQKEFALRPEMWARCFMGSDWSNTLHSLENMHRALKCAINKGKIFAHLIRCIYALDNLVHDWNCNRFTKENSCGDDDQNPSESCSDTFVEVLEEDRLWRVKIALEETHLVHRTSTSCPVANSIGTACIHCYSCSCTDYLGHEKSCAHVHTVTDLNPNPPCTALSSEPKKSTTVARKTNKTSARSVQQKVETILGFLKKGKFDDDTLRQMHEQMDVWINKVKNECLTQPQTNSDQPAIQPESNAKDVFLLIYPQQVSGSMNMKVPISRYKSPVIKKKTITNVPPGFDHTY